MYVLQRKENYVRRRCNVEKEKYDMSNGIEWEKK